jgi:transcriptional regulator with XRE-family HTH domain
MASVYSDGMTPADPASTFAANLAGNLKYLRQRRNLTQDRLARLCGLPRSTVGQIETGAGNPTLAVLSRLALALQLSIEELISPPHARVQLFPKGSLPVEKRGKNGSVVLTKILPDPIPGMEIDRMELPAGTRLTGVPHRPGTREYLACERGRLTLWTAGQRFELSPGDVLAFQGDQPHSYHNDGSVPAVGFSVVTLAPLSGSRAAPEKPPASPTSGRER